MRLFGFAFVEEFIEEVLHVRCGVGWIARIDAEGIYLSQVRLDLLLTRHVETSNVPVLHCGNSVGAYGLFLWYKYSQVQHGLARPVHWTNSPLPPTMAEAPGV